MTPDLSAIEVLREAGHTPDQLAAATDKSLIEVMAELTGRRALSDATMDAMRGLLSPHLAEMMAALAGATRATYLKEVQAGRM